MKKKQKKSPFTKFLEYYSAYSIILFARAVPLRVVKGMSAVLGDLLFFLVSKRRTIATENIMYAFPEKSDRETKEIARQSCRSFFLTFLEIVKFRYLFNRPDTIHKIRERARGVDELFRKAKAIHDESGGCIFVTPHIGNWEVLPHVSAFVGIPLAIVARPLDNERLEKLLFENRVAGGQVLIPKKNAFFVLQKTLRKGMSIGMLPDQSTMKGISIDFFDRPATTTPVPAILAITYKRPVVVVACCRKEDSDLYEGFVSDPIRPRERYASEKAEIIRITREITREMEAIIRKYPRQYLWMHNRWKKYKGKKEILSDQP
jgi:KDO2-lipid IV(A) lauroyltransferase